MEVCAAKRFGSLSAVAGRRVGKGLHEDLRGGSMFRIRKSQCKEDAVELSAGCCGRKAKASRCSLEYAGKFNLFSDRWVYVTDSFFETTPLKGCSYGV